MSCSKALALSAGGHFRTRGWQARHKRGSHLPHAAAKAGAKTDKTDAKTEVKTEIKADAKRNVQRKEAEMDMCEEDRVFMAQRRAQEREDDSKRYGEEKKRREEERRKEREEEGSDTVEKLRGKIKSLQVHMCCCY